MNLRPTAFRAAFFLVFAIPVSGLRVSVTTAVLLLALVIGPGALQANDAKWAGTWRYSGGNTEDKARLEAIEAATADVPLVARGRVREGLAQRLAPPKTLLIAVADDAITIVSDGKRLELAPDGSPKTVNGAAGQAELRARITGDKLVVTAQTKRALRTTSYTRKAKRLVVAETVASKLLFLQV